MTYPELQEHATLIIICSVIGYGVTEITKPFIKGRFDDAEKGRAVVRLVSVLFAAAAGYTLGWAWFHLWCGAGAGVLNAWLVKILKRGTERRFGLESTPPPRKPQEPQDK